jgi:RNA polymerase sigma factor (sigma-70 family)
MPPTHPLRRTAQPAGPPPAPEPPRADASATDPELLAALAGDPHRAWPAFLDRYADFILSVLRGLGLDRDEAMDRFVYVCEKLVEDDFRRLRSIRFLGPAGDLRPWLAQVTRRLAVNWAWSVAGRRRPNRDVERLPIRDQEIFALYMWQGYGPSEIHRHLETSGYPGLGLFDVLDALERILRLLGSRKIWRHVSLLARQRRPVPIQAGEDGSAAGFEPVDRRADPERRLIGKEGSARLAAALDRLRAEERLALQLRFEEALTAGEISTILGLPERRVRSLFKRAMRRLRRELADG